MVSIKRTSTEAGHADEQGGQGVAGADDLAGLDLDLDDLDANFGSLDELAESLEILEEGQHHSIGSGEMATSTGAAAAAPATAAESVPPAQTPADRTKLLSQVDVGSRIEVYWTGDERYYPGTLASRVLSLGPHVYEVQYDDGDYHDLDLRKEQFRILKDGGSVHVGSDLVSNPNRERRADGKGTSIFTDDDDRLMEQLVEKDLAESGNARVRPGFWEKINNEHFAGRGLTVQMMKSRRCRQNATTKKRLSSDDAEESRPNIFTDDDDRLVGQLIKKDLAESGRTIVRPGFWEKINHEHFAGRGFTAKMLIDRRRNQTKKNKRLASGATKKSNDGGSVHIGSDLVIPDGIDTSNLPSGWEDIVRAELKACGMEGGGDAAGEPPTRKRMGYERTAKHYKVAQAVARVLVKIVDANLKEAGIPGQWSSVFTDDDDRLVGEFIAKEHAESGRTMVRPGFWEKINNEHFAGRGLTAQMLICRRSNQLEKKKRLASGATKESRHERTSQVLEGVSRHSFARAEDAIIRDAATRQIQESGTDKLPAGFWPSVIEAHSMRRDSQQLSKRWYVLKSMVNSDEVVETSVPLRSSCERDTTGDGKEQKKTSLKGIFSDEERQLMERLVQEELQQCGGERVRRGFWGGVLEKYFADRNLTIEQLRNYYKHVKRRGMVASEDLSSSNDAQAINNSYGENHFTSDEDEIIIKEAVNELRKHVKLRHGFWPKVVEKHSLNRTPAQLKSRCSYLKSRGKIDLSETSETSSSNVGGTVTSEQSEAIPTAEQGPSGVHDVQSHSDTVPHTEDLILFPAYQATTTKYPPQTLVNYRPSSGKATIVGRVLEVGIYPSDDNLYVYTISSDDDAGTGVQYERIPERLLEKR